jgi:hypothetical protein
MAVGIKVILGTGDGSQGSTLKVAVYLLKWWIVEPN